mmetsp:Transcript_99097/g.280674  ORF Transcript_99097/g.280674 Transcript_99097/m.280674 type:complete len:205 (+) Transcript_99097:1027-1641(+)
MLLGVPPAVAGAGATSAHHRGCGPAAPVACSRSVGTPEIASAVTSVRDTGVHKLQRWCDTQGLRPGEQQPQGRRRPVSPEPAVRPAEGARLSERPPGRCRCHPPEPSVHKAQGPAIAHFGGKRCINGQRAHAAYAANLGPEPEHRLHPGCGGRAQHAEVVPRAEEADNVHGPDLAVGPHAERVTKRHPVGLCTSPASEAPVCPG